MVRADGCHLPTCRQRESKAQQGEGQGDEQAGKGDQAVVQPKKRQRKSAAGVS